jgi:hypothetical protein
LRKPLWERMHEEKHVSYNEMDRNLASSVRVG